MNVKLIDPQQSVKAEAALYQRPGDRLTKPLYSHNEKTHNLVLKITLPKAQGLKAKFDGRSSGAHPGEESSGLETDPATSLLAKIHTHSRDYQIDIIGIVDQTHRFRSLPDFVKSSRNSPFMQKMKDTILPFDYEKVKEFRLDMSKSVELNTEIIPPPSWSQFEVPFNYAYKQNPAVVTTIDQAGRPRTWNSQVRAKTRSQVVAANTRSLPTGPPTDAPAISSLDPILQELIGIARTVLDGRPIVTRRSLPNLIPGDGWQRASPNHSKNIFQYLGYTFSSGPWKDALIKFGVDPRTDPKYRVYQTLTFVLDTPPKRKTLDNAATQSTIADPEPPPPKESHIFDGQRLSRDGKTWQVCDITDPLLKDVLDTVQLRRDCHLDADGWFYNGTWVKAKSIMRWKIAGMLTGENALTDVEYSRVASILPDVFNEAERLGLADLTADLTVKEKELASTIRMQYRRVGESDVASQVVDRMTPSPNDGDATMSDILSISV